MIKDIISVSFNICAKISIQCVPRGAFHRLLGGILDYCKFLIFHLFSMKLFSSQTGDICCWRRPFMKAKLDWLGIKITLIYWNKGGWKRKRRVKRRRRRRRGWTCRLSAEKKSYDVWSFALHLPTGESSVLVPTPTKMSPECHNDVANIWRGCHRNVTRS